MLKGGKGRGSVGWKRQKEKVEEAGSWRRRGGKSERENKGRNEKRETRQSIYRNILVSR